MGIGILSHGQRTTSVKKKKKKRNKSPDETQLVFSFRGFGFIFLIESIHHQALIHDKVQVLCNDGLIQYETCSQSL